MYPFENGGAAALQLLSTPGKYQRESQTYRHHWYPRVTGYRPTEVICPDLGCQQAFPHHRRDGKRCLAVCKIQ